MAKALSTEPGTVNAHLARPGGDPVSYDRSLGSSARLSPGKTLVKAQSEHAPKLWETSHVQD